MAEAFCNQLAKGKVKAGSAGTLPAESVEPMVVEVMREVGIDVSNRRPNLLTQDMLDHADKLIVMGCDVGEACPLNFTASDDWGLEDPEGKPRQKVREIRDQVKARVITLLKELGIPAL